MSVMIRAHAMAYHAIHEVQPEAQVGLAHNYRGMQAAHRWHLLERASAAFRSTIFNDRIAQAVHDGRLRFPLPRETLAQAARTQDFIGLNYYTTENVTFDLRASSELLGRSGYPAGSDVSPSGFVANRPEGFWQALRWARRFRLPIVISENGIDDSTDRVRPRYLASHLRQLWRAVNFNWNVRGYLHWTLVDNFEWERGWSQRFGLWALDPVTQARTRRPSADLYAKICKSNGLSSEMVAEHAPEVLDELFPRSGPGRVAFEPPV
jgi:beta-glucosidase